MKKEKSKESKPMTALERGQEFLDGFKKLPYSTDRIGQSFVMKASVASKPTLKEEVLKTSSKELSATEQDSSPKEEANKGVKKKQYYAVALNPKVIELSQEDLEHLAEWLALKYPQKP